MELTDIIRDLRAWAKYLHEHEPDSAAVESVCKDMLSAAVKLEHPLCATCNVPLATCKHKDASWKAKPAHGPIPCSSHFAGSDHYEAGDGPQGDHVSGCLK